MVPNLKTPITWLSIELTCQRQEDKVDFLIKFINTQAEVGKFTFSNQNRKAELLGLRIMRQNGQRVSPTHNMLIKPASIEDSVRFLGNGECFSYTLSGEIIKTSLVFAGAVFELSAGEIFETHFQYAGKKSNSITLTL